MKRRVEIPDDVAANILVASNRICCVCCEAGKPLHIHHIDENPSNNDPANLAVLCLVCHDEAHIKGGFARKLDAAQIRLFKAEWERRVQERKAKVDEAVVAGLVSKEHAIGFWDTSSSRHLIVQSPRLNMTPVWYHDQHGRRLLYIAHIEVRTSPSEIPALDCEMRLVKTYSRSAGDRDSRDPSALKVTRSWQAFRQSIPPDSTGTFDLFGMDATSYPDTYLLSQSDVPPLPIISTAEKHILTYQIFARDFPPITFQIALDLGPPFSPSYESGVNAHSTSEGAQTATPYPSSGYPQIVTVMVPGQEYSEPNPRIWKPLPNIDLVRPSSS